jgi:hypothetical protein
VSASSYGRRNVTLVRILGRRKLLWWQAWKTSYIVEVDGTLSSRDLSMQDRTSETRTPNNLSQFDKPQYGFEVRPRMGGLNIESGGCLKERIFG